VSRDTGEKIIVATDHLETKITEVLDDIQNQLFEKAKRLREEKTYVALNFGELKEIFAEKTGFVKAMWCGDRSCEDQIKEETGATSRCIPFEQKAVSSQCVCCGKDAKDLVYWAKAY